nr:reverse transcriptase domain-containing protein [Tanacetum cinerariifolium]
MTNPEDITDPTTAMNMALALMAKAFKLNYSTPTNNNQRISSNPRNRQIAQPGMNMGQDRQMQMVKGNGGNQFRQYVGKNAGNLNGYNVVKNVGNQVAQNPRVQNVVQGNGNQNRNGNLMAARAEGNAAGHNGNQIRCYNCRGIGHFARDCTVRPRRRDAAYLQTQLLIAQKEETGIQLQAKKYDLMAAVADLDEIEEVNANCILMANLQQASISSTQTDNAPVYDTDGSAEVDENCDDNEIFNMFTQEEQYTELLKPIPESHQTTREALQIIENKSKVRYSRNKPNVSRMNTTSKENASKTDDRIDKLADQISTLVDIFAKKVVTPAPVKAVEESCGQGNNFNRGNNFHGNQPFQVPNQGFQSQHFQVPNNPIQQGFSNEFSSYKRANDQMMRNMQSQINSLKGEFKNEIQNTMKSQQTVLMEQQNAFQNNLQNMLSGFFQNQASTSGTLPSNTIPNSKGEIKAITTRSGVAYEGLSIPTPKKVVERETEETTDKEQTNFQGKLTSTRMTHKLADRSITPPKGVVKDIFVKVGKFHFSTDFVVVDFEADPRVPLILGRSFLRTVRALIDVYGEEITLQEIHGFSKNSLGGNPTSTSEPILSNSSPSLTPFEESGFILEKIEAYLKDESISPEIDHADCDPEGDICLIEKLLNDDPFQLLPMDLKQGEVVKAKSLIEEPPKLELKDLPSHLEYAYLEGVDKLPVIIAKDLKVDEKEALLKVLKSHKTAIA